jgi:hypothetical protein
VQHIGSVLIHAGMFKTGSSSIQTWLRDNATELHDVHHITIVRENSGPAEMTRFEPFTGGRSVTTMAFLMQFHAGLQRSAPQEELSALVDGFIDGLDRVASTLGTVLLTAEGFTSLFSPANELFLQGLDRLAQLHEVRVAYYVRPQDGALESRWRQWGYRSELTPASWVASQADQLHYAGTVDLVNEVAPTVSFEVRPFRSDLLDGGNVITDFGHRFLRLDDPPRPIDHYENAGLPLDLAILLRGAPASLLATPGAAVETGRRQLELGLLGRSWAIAESPRALRSRQVLHRYAYDTFEEENGALARRLQWSIDSFISRPEASESHAGTHLAELDQLWEPSGDETERAYLYAALSDLILDLHPR